MYHCCVRASVYTPCTYARIYVCNCESMPMFVYSVCTTCMDIFHTIAQEYGECTVLIPCKWWNKAVPVGRQHIWMAGSG